MASITITVQSLLNAALYNSYTIEDTNTIGDLKTVIQNNTGLDPSWYVLTFDDEVLNDANTLASYSIVEGSSLRSGNVIGYLPTLQDRQLAKLNLAVLDRTYAGNPFRTYDIDLLPSQYIGNVSTPNMHPDGLIEGRPWIIPAPPLPPPNPIVYLNATNRLSYSGTGTTWFDLIDGNNAQLLNNPTFSSSPGSIDFDSTNLQWAEIPDLGSLSVWTVESWFYLQEDLTGYITAIVCNEFDLSTSLNFSMGTNNSPGSYNLSVGFFDGTWHSTTGFVPEVNTWYHSVGTYDGSTIKQYVNGALIDSLSYTGTPTSGGNTRIASRWDDQTLSSDFFPGSISLVRIYDQALTEFEVNQVFVSTAPAYLPSVTFDFSVFGVPPYLPGNQIEDTTGSFNPTTGFSIGNGTATAPYTGSGVAFLNLTQDQIDFFNSSSYSNGYVWNVTWGYGSTYPTTPVAMYYDNMAGYLIYWILDPTDLTYTTAIQNGIFNFPATFTEGTIPTNFTN